VQVGVIEVGYWALLVEKRHLLCHLFGHRALKIVDVFRLHGCVVGFTHAGCTVLIFYDGELFLRVVRVVLVLREDLVAD